MMASGISPQQLERYHQDGILFPVDVLTEAEANSYRRQLEAFEQSYCAGPQKRILNLHRFFPWAFHLATAPRLLDTVEAILGAELLIDGTLFFCKPPHTSNYVSWHQDSPYSGWHLSPSVSAWIALSDSTVESGCMQAIPGSHTQGLIPHSTIPDDANLLSRGQRAQIPIDEGAIANITLSPGQMSLHHSNVLHSSKPNESDNRRIGFIVRFVTPQTSTVDRPLVQVRGNSICTHLTLAPPPTETDSDQAFRHWKCSPHATPSAPSLHKPIVFSFKNETAKG